MKIFVTIIMLVILGLVLVPIGAKAEAPEPTDWIQEGWYEEYCEWIAEQQALQQQFTEETGYGLGALIDFVDWARMKAESGIYWQGHSYLFCDSTGEQRIATWSWSV